MSETSSSPEKASPRGLFGTLRDGARASVTLLRSKHDHIATASSAKTYTEERMGRLVLHLHGASGLPTSVVSAYAVVSAGPFQRRTATIASLDANPDWHSKMAFPIFLPEDGEPLCVQIEVFDENFVKNMLLSAGTIEISLTAEAKAADGDGRESVGNDDCGSANSVVRRLHTTNLAAPDGGDGGVLRYSAEVMCIQQLEAKLSVLEAVARVPLLPAVADAALSAPDKVRDIRDSAVDTLLDNRPVQLARASFGVVHSAVTSPVNTARSAVGISVVLTHAVTMHALKKVGADERIDEAWRTRRLPTQ